LQIIHFKYKKHESSKGYVKKLDGMQKMIPVFNRDHLLYIPLIAMQINGE